MSKVKKAPRKGVNPRRYFTCPWNNKRYDSRDYGHEAWPIGRRGR